MHETHFFHFVATAVIYIETHAPTALLKVLSHNIPVNPTIGSLQYCVITILGKFKIDFKILNKSQRCTSARFMSILYISENKAQKEKHRLYAESVIK